MDTVTTHREIQQLERLAARGFVVFGGLFWVVAAVAGPAVLRGMDPATAARTVFWPFAATVITLVIGWTHERLAAVLLLAGSAAVVVWGVLYGWESGVWVIMSVVLIAPMVIAAVLFTFAARVDFADEDL